MRLVRIFLYALAIIMGGDFKMDEKTEKKLTPLQIEVTQNCGTEPAFNNIYWDI